MTDYKCEETSSSCTNFQSAICLHCNRRLCVSHIIEHDQNAFRDKVKKLSNLVEVIIQQIKDKSEKSRLAYDNSLPSFNEWQEQQLEKIQQIYQHELQLIEFQEKTLESFHQYLLEQLERGARLPLERMQRQESFNADILHHIRQIIDKIRKECRNSKWKFPKTPSPINTDSIFPSISITGNNKLIEKQSTADNTEISQVGTTLNCPIKQLIERFSYKSSILLSKVDIDICIKKNKSKLSTIVNAYLTACHQKPTADEKLRILNEHISTIKRYLENRESDFDVLIGIQTFFFNNIFQDDEKCGIMAFLLKFFLDHQCINQNLILKWYNSDQARQYEGFEQAKQLAKPLVESFDTGSQASSS